MRNNRHARVTIIMVTITITIVVTSLFAATMTIMPRQADALSIYDQDAANRDTLEENIDQPLEQDDYTTTKPTVDCAMDTIENLQSFLSCLGAK
jgi:hypothetical protein